MEEEADTEGNEECVNIAPLPPSEEKEEEEAVDVDVIRGCSKTVGFPCTSGLETDSN